MFFQEHEKRIWSPKSLPDLKYDPLAVDRELNRATAGRLDELIRQWRPVPLAPDGKPMTGDISEEGIVLTKLAQGEAEEKLVVAARRAFKLKDFPDTTDAEVLEVLVDYLWYMEGKGQTAGMPQTSSPPSESGSDQVN